MGGVFSQSDSNVMKGLGTVGKIFKRSAEREAIRTVKDGIWHGVRRKAEQGLRGPKKNNSSRRRINNQDNIELMPMNNKSGTNNSRPKNNNAGLGTQNTGLGANNIENNKSENSTRIKGGSRKKSKK
jgi:hypothetical protein